MSGVPAPVQVKLIVVDSLTFHLRQDLQDMAHRTRLLAQLAQDLMRLAEERGIAVSHSNLDPFLDVVVWHAVLI